MAETGMSLGTPHYMSPEQAMGEREITDSAGTNHSPVWSADGRFVQFVSDHEGQTDIFRIRADGRHPSDSRSASASRASRSSADSRRLAYNVYRTMGNIWSVSFGPDQ